MVLTACNSFAQSSRIDTRLTQLSRQSDNPKEQVDSIVQLYGDMLKEMDPTAASFAYGFTAYDGRWTDISSHASIRNKAWYQQILAAIKKINKTGLAKTDDLYLSLIEKSASESVQRIGYNLYLMPINQMFGLHKTIVSVINGLPINSPKDADNVLRMMAGIDQVIEQILSLLGEGTGKGIVPAKITIAPVIDQIKAIIKDTISKSPFYNNFVNLRFSSDSSTKAILQQKAKDIITKQINPAYQKLLNYIQNDYYSKCRDNVSLSSLPQGKEIYQFLVGFFTSTNLTAEQIHQLGIAEVKRILGEMKSIREKSGFKGSEKEFNEFLRTDPRFFYTSASDLVQGYRDISKRIDPELVKLFGKLPRLPYGVQPVPDYAAPSQPTAYYMLGSHQQARPGFFYANTYDLKSRPKWEMEALTLHEAVPGHHLQIALEGELTQPDFLKFQQITAFTEGWGLYAESLGEQLGLYQDIYSRYGQLTYELWRAIRLVIDTGIHFYGWSSEEANNYFTKNSPKPLKDIQVEVDRYIAIPGQAVSYKIGQLKISELKQTAQKALGAGFSIRDFHDVVLGSGSIPLSLLQENVNAWIAENKR
ncbi:MAG: hypothetical protein JWQ40_4239 [Segetibacter sp.]|nr:hypothetical protein [Segetibacter sp.]